MPKRRKPPKTTTTDGEAIVILVVVSYLVKWLLSLTILEFLMLLAFGATLLTILLRLYRQTRQWRLVRKELLDLKAPQFEQRVELLLKDLGWEHVNRTGGRGDGGVDVRATHEGQKWVVQCKRYAVGNRVTPNDVRALIGTVELEKADCGLLVTTSHFTQQGYQHARSARCRIDLWDGKTLAGKIEHAKAANRTVAQRMDALRKLLLFYGLLIFINALIVGLVQLGD
jgi:HJR/Mrr/RecB family endonuclease